MQYCAHCGNAVEAVSYAPCPRCGNPSNGARQPVAPVKGTNTALIIVLVVVGLVVVIAVVGIIAAIAIPSLLRASHGSKQKRTMADIRSLGTAVEAYSVDAGSYPKGSTQADLAQALAPRYIKVLPGADGWGHELHYVCIKDTTSPDSDKCSGYVIASAGADGRFEQDSIESRAAQPPRPTTSFDCDIVYSSGKFVEYPEGAQP